MTLEEHAAAIQTAINNAAADGFTLDDGDCGTVRLDLNRCGEHGRHVAWIEITVPD